LLKAIRITNKTFKSSKAAQATFLTSYNTQLARVNHSMWPYRFVAPITITWSRGFMPSINVNSCDTMRLSTSPCVYVAKRTSLIPPQTDAYAYLFSFWRDGIDFINKNNGWRILLSFFKSSSKITFRLARHF
jgi:hypothetical protein